MKDSELKFAVCHSEDIDTVDAMEDLFEKASEQLNNQIPDACMLFAAIDYDHNEMLNIILEKWPNIQLIGGTTDGEMSSELGFAEDSIVMILFKSDKIRFTAGLGEGIISDLEEATQNAVVQATDGGKIKPKLIFSVPGNVAINIDRVVASISEKVGENVPIFGAVPGDQWRFQKQYQFFNNKVCTDSVPILSMSGDFHFEYGVDSGWEPLGEIGVVNKTEGNIVYEINHLPAFDYYKRVLGELSTPSGEFPIVVLDDNNEIMYQRAAAKLLEDNSGAIVFMGEIPLNSKIQIASAQRETIINGTRRSINEAKNKLSNQENICGALLFSCAARKALLGTHTKQEIKVAKEILGEEIPIAGFYGYGELSPLKRNSSDNKLHNQTFVTLIFA